MACLCGVATIRIPPGMGKLALEFWNWNNRTIDLALGKEADRPSLNDRISPRPAALELTTGSLDLGFEARGLSASRKTRAAIGCPPALISLPR